MIDAARRSLRATRLLVPFLVASPLLACGGDGDGEPSGPTPVASVTVTSPIEDVIAVDRSVQLTATAEDASGNTLSGRSFTWDSSDESVAIVDEAGLVQGLASGDATITATAGGVSGSLATIAGLLDDASGEALLSGMTAEAGERLGTALEDCSAALDAGHVLDLRDCVQQIRAESATDPTDRALLAVLGVIALRAELLLNL